MTRPIGIDLGTTNSCVAVLEAGEPTVIANAEGFRTTPSIVAFARGGDRLVGEVAKRQSVTNVDRTVRSVKRRMGSEWAFDVDGEAYSPQELSALVLGKLKRDAEAYLGEVVSEAVITVPAYFTDAQRQATKEAGQIAGLHVSRIVNEPTAAAMAYGIDKAAHFQTVLVFDLGGGTFDVSLLEIGDGIVEVRATAGNNQLGGDDWDARVVSWLLTRFRDRTGKDLSADRPAVQRLAEAAEAAKIHLSTFPEARISLPYLTQGPAGPLHLDDVLSREEFEDLTADLLTLVHDPVEQVLSDAGVAPGEIDQLLLVGGSTRMPAVVATASGLVGGLAPHSEVNPDEVVAVGAALQAGVLAGEVKDVLLLDVTPLSLGIETKGGVMTPLIRRNTAIPTRHTEVFSTAEDDQETVEVRVAQGERQLWSLNQPLGTFELSGIAPAPRGVPAIEVTFDIDTDGLVQVSARDTGSGREQSMTVTGGSSLPPHEIARMIAEAARNEAEDRRQRQMVALRNHADSLVYEAQRILAAPAAGLRSDTAGLLEETRDLLRLLLADSRTSSQLLEEGNERLLTVLNQAQIEATPPPAPTEAPDEADEVDQQP